MLGSSRDTTSEACPQWHCRNKAGAAPEHNKSEKKGKKKGKYSKPGRKYYG